MAASTLGWLVLARGEGLFSAPGLLAVIGATALAGFAYHRQTGLPRLTALLSLMVFFLHQSIAGGLDVARRALTPRMPIAPEILHYETRLERESARVLFANLMSLLPGTLCCRLDGHRLHVHALCGARAARQSLAALESRIHNAFG